MPHLKIKAMTVQCYICKNQFKLKVRVKDYQDWFDGKLIQEAFPYLSPGERELLISGTCVNCFRDIWEVEK